MKSQKKWLFRILALLVLVIVVIVMFIIGRGHTVYFDNATVEYDGKSLDCPYAVEVIVKDEKIAKLFKRERGMVDTMGQQFHMDLLVTEEKGGAEESYAYDLKLPYGMDGIVLNLPAILAGAPEEVYLSEFVSLAPETEEVEEEVIIDEFEMPLEGE